MPLVWVCYYVQIFLTTLYFIFIPPGFHLDAGLPEAVACLDRLTDDTVSVEETDCATVKLCVETGTTTIDVVRNTLPEDIIVEVPNLSAAYQALIDGKCSAVAGGRAEVAEPSAALNGYAEESYTVSANMLLRDPLAMVARDNDRRWCDIMFWTQQALVSAEEQGVTQSTADDLSLTSAFGDEFDNIFVEIIRAVGNYGEVQAKLETSHVYFTLCCASGLFSTLLCENIANCPPASLSAVFWLRFGLLSTQHGTPHRIEVGHVCLIHVTAVAYYRKRLLLLGKVLCGQYIVINELD